MTRTSAISCAALLVCAVVTWGCGESAERQDASKPVRARPVATGFVFEAPEQGVHLEAESLHAEGLRFGDFRINLVQHLILRAGVLRLDVSSQRSQGSARDARQDVLREAFALASSLVRSANGAYVLRHGAVEVRRGETLLHRVTADEIRAADGALELDGHVRVQTRRGEILDAARARWAYEGFDLYVAGPFSLSRGDRQASGWSEWFRLALDGSLRVPDTAR